MSEEVPAIPSAGESDRMGCMTFPWPRYQTSKVLQPGEEVRRVVGPRLTPAMGWLAARSHLVILAGSLTCFGVWLGSEALMRAAGGSSAKQVAFVVGGLAGSALMIAAVVFHSKLNQHRWIVVTNRRLLVFGHGQVLCDCDLDLLRRLLPDADAAEERVIDVGTFGRICPAKPVPSEAIMDAASLVKLVEAVRQLDRLR